MSAPLGPCLPKDCEDIGLGAPPPAAVDASSCGATLTRLGLGLGIGFRLGFRLGLGLGFKLRGHLEQVRVRVRVRVRVQAAGRP